MNHAAPHTECWPVAFGISQFDYWVDLYIPGGVWEFEGWTQQ